MKIKSKLSDGNSTCANGCCSVVLLGKKDKKEGKKSPHCPPRLGPITNTYDHTSSLFL